MIEKSDIESKPKLNPAETKLFFGNTYETTLQRMNALQASFLKKQTHV
jgi:hypothetical protein